MGRIIRPQRSLITLFNRKGGDFIQDYISPTSGAYTVANWVADDPKASPRPTQWIDRKNGYVANLLDALAPDTQAYEIIEGNSEINGHNSISLPTGTYYGAQVINTDMTLEMDGATDLLDAFSVYIVYKYRSHTGNRSIITLGQADYTVIRRITTSNDSWLQGGSAFGNTIPNPLLINTWYVDGISNKEGLSMGRKRVNLNTVSTYTLSTSYGTSVTGLGVNGDVLRNVYLGVVTGMDIAEIICRQGQDSEDDITATNTYLTSKYGIT